MEIRDRVKGLRRVRAGSLRPHPLNWRGHPTRQRTAMRGMLDEVGFADALLVRELPGGELELIDGHLRAELAAEVEVPVLVLDLDDEEAAKLLALHDPLGALAETNETALASLVRELEVQRDVLRTLLDDLAAERDSLEGLTDGGGAVEPALAASYQVVVDCESEARQESLFKRLKNEGFGCRLLTL